jgi:SPP1 family predicted phage head-tail adaptor
MRAGRLRHQITIQQSTPAQNAKGEPIDSWGTFATVWASIEPIGGGERFAADQVIADATHRVTIRYTAGVEPKMRVLFGSRVFDIREVRNLEERNRTMELTCRELNP